MKCRYVGGKYMHFMTTNSHQTRNVILGRILSLECGRKLISQYGDPLGCSGRFIMDGCRQHGFLPGHPLHLGNTGPHHYGRCLRSSHLLPKLHHLSIILSSALHKKRGGAALTREGRTGKSGVGKFFLDSPELGAEHPDQPCLVSPIAASAWS
jgi:hypothetical protein